MKINFGLRCSGWWLTYPSEKWWSESQLGLWNSQYMEKQNSCSKPPTSFWSLWRSLTLWPSKKLWNWLDLETQRWEEFPTAVSPRALSQTKVQLGPILNPSGLSANCHWNSLEFPGIHWSSREFHGYLKTSVPDLFRKFPSVSNPLIDSSWVDCCEDIFLSASSKHFKTWLKISWEIEIPSGNLT